MNKSTRTVADFVIALLDGLDDRADDIWDELKEEVRADNLEVFAKVDWKKVSVKDIMECKDFQELMKGKVEGIIEHLSYQVDDSDDE